MAGGVLQSCLGPSCPWCPPCLASPSPLGRASLPSPTLLLPFSPSPAFPRMPPPPPGSPAAQGAQSSSKPKYYFREMANKSPQVFLMHIHPRESSQVMSQVSIEVFIKTSELSMASNFTGWQNATFLPLTSRLVSHFLKGTKRV